MSNDLYVTVLPDAIKVVNNNSTVYSSQGDADTLFINFWDWFNTVWSVQSHDSTIIHIVKQG